MEGPYGCFTFGDDRPRQIWIGGGIGITPFLARMKHMALQKGTPDWPLSQQIDLFHSTADVDEEARGKLTEGASGADVHLHVLIDARDSYLTGERIREPEVRHLLVRQGGAAGIDGCAGHAGCGECRNPVCRSPIADRLTVTQNLGPTDAVKHAVAASLGISIVLDASVTNEVRDGRLHAIEIEDAALAKDIYVIIPAKTPPNSEIHRFVAFLME
ncbi:DNA-binding transcriptional LysR family regulator [Pseudochelatococcus lubricantis]|uniref:DNA-binding transcriptional LysR family regulator n=1 Tax=Pseudochelatococcus lubricantis TaxID=1538102 RepID=A0ABX0V4W8_9HYPH|nr:DNA-binding transcriptional LysR family regulator [Pseudochelatococcus lubricantis]